MEALGIASSLSVRRFLIASILPNHYYMHLPIRAAWLRRSRRYDAVTQISMTPSFSTHFGTHQPHEAVSSEARSGGPHASKAATSHDRRQGGLVTGGRRVGCRGVSDRQR